VKPEPTGSGYTAQKKGRFFRGRNQPSAWKGLSLKNSRVRGGKAQKEGERAESNREKQVHCGGKGAGRDRRAASKRTWRKELKRWGRGEKQGDDLKKLGTTT